MKCNCISNVKGFGTPDCLKLPSKIVRLFFTNDLDSYPMSGVGKITEKFNYDIPFYFEDDIKPLHPTNTDNLFANVWAMVSPVIDLSESDRPDPVTETIGSTTYFVKNSSRTFTATVGRKAVELGKLFEELRCFNNLGVLLLDSDGVLWGMRASNYSADIVNGTYHNEMVKAIPINPSSLSAKMSFPSDNTVQKWVISFQFLESFNDYDLVPVIEDSALLSYNPPINVDVNVYSISVGSTTKDVTFGVFARFYYNGQQIIQPLALNNVNLTLYDSNMNNIGFVQPQSIGNGIYLLDNIPIATKYVKYSPNDLYSQWSTFDSKFDWYHFKVVV